MLGKGLELNGELCSIGVAKDALYQSAEDDRIIFDLLIDERLRGEWGFFVSEKKLTDTFLPTTAGYSGRIIDNDEQIFSTALFSTKFHYISAFRNGPLQSYEKDTSGVEIFNQMSRKDGRCELVAHYLDYFKNKPISDSALRFNSEGPDNLLYQVSQWLRTISPGINVQVESFESSFKLNYNYTRGEQRTPTDYFKATNIGFGISYALPIIVAALHMPKDSIILIENPESHIHPDGQAQLMELICKAAATGVQFIIETHSDHIVNGLLVAVKKGIIKPEQSSVYFFGKDTASHATQAVELPVLPGGKIRRPPEGFFDRIDKDMKTLMGF
jgi:predicted ATPase